MSSLNLYGLNRPRGAAKLLMRILITGGFGFIGGRLAQHLSELGHSITLGSRRHQNPPPWLENARIVTTDWENTNELRLACKDIDIIIHAAGMNAQDSLSDPNAAHIFNGDMTKVLIEAAAKENLKRFIYLSTAHVYASPLNGRIDELTPTLNLHPYASSHLKGEYAILDFCKLNTIEGIIARLSNVYGAPASLYNKCWNLFTNDLCKQAFETGELTINTNGNQKRDFLDITSACEMISFLCNTSIKPHKSCIFNLGSGKSLSLIKMAELIQERCRINYGFTPKINVNEKYIVENNSDLKFITSKILQAGYSFKHNISHDIDNLLFFAMRHFTHLARNEKF